MRNTEQDTTPDAFEVEPDDLRQPNGSVPRWQPWPSSTRLKAWLKQHWQTLGALGALLVIILSLAGSFPTPPRAPVWPVAIRMQADGLSCLQTLTWAPDSRRVAMVGYRQQCPIGSGKYQRSLLNIYDTNSGRRLREIEPDKPILAAISTLLPAQILADPIIYYTALLWSGQAQRLALPFSVWQLPGQHTLEGVLLLDENGRHARVLLQRPTASAPYDEWDVQRGTLVSTSLNLPASPIFFSTLPAAPAYRWRPEGALLPDSRASQGRIGNPVGDASFSFWQPGRAWLLTSLGGAVEKPGVYLWETLFSAWSPDGRYLLALEVASGRLQPAGIAPPRPQTLTNFQLDDAPLMPVRDAAMLAVLRLLPQAPSELTQSLALAWRPDGHVLAAYGFVLDVGLVVNLYESTTGRQLLSLPTPTSGSSPTLLWSPDGSRLLLMVGPAATIWQPNLPTWL